MLHDILQGWKFVFQKRWTLILSICGSQRSQGEESQPVAWSQGEGAERTSHRECARLFRWLVFFLYWDYWENQILCSLEKGWPPDLQKWRCLDTNLLWVNVYLDYWLPHEIQNSWQLSLWCFFFELQKLRYNPKLRGLISSFLPVKCTSSTEPTLGHCKSIANKSVALFLSLIERESTISGITLSLAYLCLNCSAVTFLIYFTKWWGIKSLVDVEMSWGTKDVKPHSRLNISKAHADVNNQHKNYWTAKWSVWDVVILFHLFPYNSSHYKIV